MITWPVNKEQEKSTHRRHMSPLVLYTATTVFPEVYEDENGVESVKPSYGTHTMM